VERGGGSGGVRATRAKVDGSAGREGEGRRLEKASGKAVKQLVRSWVILVCDSGGLLSDISM
jgi:hypothetical protein